MLINGAGGGSGSFAIQLAKRAGAHVTGVDNAGKLDFMRSLGADEVIDYRSEDFTRTDEPYDLILDLVAHRSVFAYRRALAPGGRYRCVGGSVPTLLRVADARLVARPAHRAPTGGARRCSQGPAHFSPLTDLCVAGDSASTSTAPSRSTRCPRRCATSARDAPSARSSWRSTERRPRGPPLVVRVSHAEIVRSGPGERSIWAWRGGSMVRSGV